MQDGLQLAADNVGAGNYLGDPVTVEQLVRNFFSAVFSERAKFHEAGDGDASTDSLNELCRKYAAVFMGESSAYKAQPWNSPYRLGNYLRAVVPDVGDYATPAEGYFNFLAVQALNASIALEQGAMSEDEVKEGMAEVIDDAVKLLLGLPRG